MLRSQYYLLTLALAASSSVYCSDITNVVFNTQTNVMPAAFGDFNSDELTDVFVLREDRKTVEILLAHEEEPLLRPANPTLRCAFKDELITSVVPGDFDGDAFMDVMVTTMHRGEQPAKNKNHVLTYVYLIWGGGNHLNCSTESIIQLIGQPLALDYNQDMIIDLFGADVEENRAFWIFNKERNPPEKYRMMDNRRNVRLNMPHAHAFIDLNEDHMADLFITTRDDFEIWLGSENSPTKFVFNKTINHPDKATVIGQSIFMDVELRGQMDLVTPVCYGSKCDESALLVHSNGSWHNLEVNFKNESGFAWNFAHQPGSKYTNVITLHSGDFNMDGYPDILATLTDDKKYGHSQSFLLENVACTTGCGEFRRSFAIKWNALSPFRNGTAMAAFFDFYQDGILDVILVTYDGSEYRAAAFKNSLDYDANFIKVMALTGLSNQNNPTTMGRVGKKRKTYGTNLPGPMISYKTTTQEGYTRHGASGQLPQSAHFSLHLPYTIFGLGRTPNFVDSLTVGLSNHSRSWTQIIPNSQMVVIPWPPTEPSRWKAQLFVTPSKLILMSVAALTGICGIITVIIGVLYWKERQEDRKERLSESHRFHFDAM